MLVSLERSKTQAGVIYASYFVAYTVFSPILGTLSDGFGSRLLLSSFSTLLATGVLLMVFVTTVPTAAAIFALAGIGHAALLDSVRGLWLWCCMACLCGCGDAFGNFVFAPAERLRKLKNKRMIIIVGNIDQDHCYVGEYREESSRLGSFTANIIYGGCT
jgi:MFS family permease